MASSVGMSVAETKIALVPRIIATARGIDRYYGLVLTDLRAIFVLEWTFRRDLALLGLFGGFACGIVLAVILNAQGNLPIFLVVGLGFIGGTIPRAFNRRRTVGYDALSPDDLARLEGTIVVPFTALERLSIARASPRVPYRLNLDHIGEDGHRGSLRFVVRPEPTWLRAQGRTGAKIKAAYDAHAASVRQAFEKALPPDVASKVLASA